MEVPVFSIEEAFKRHQQSVSENPGAVGYRAFYSSLLKGIVTDPAMMIVPMDEHMVHRGHAVFDTCTVREGKVYQLEQHLDRFEYSASKAHLPLPYSRQQMKEIILATIRAAKVRIDEKAMVRYWIGGGVGGFGILRESKETTFYVMVHPMFPAGPQGIKLCTSTVELKNQYLATMKTTNYLMNALVSEEAVSRGCSVAVQTDASGFLTESSTANCAIITKDRVFRHPPFSNILKGITVSRVLQHAQSLVSSGELSGVEVGPIALDYAKANALEVMVLGGSKVSPVTEWDGVAIGDGKPGHITMMIYQFLEQDELSGDGQIIDL